ncbi:32121_t:CDS:2, partial [Racocetra persica]
FVVASSLKRLNQCLYEYDMKNMAYNALAKIPGIGKITNYGKGNERLSEARNQKDLATSALVYVEAINNLEIAHEKHPTLGEIKETLTQARKEYEEVKKKLPLSEIIENKFFKKNHVSKKKNLPPDEDHEPNDTRQLVCELHREDVSYEQMEESCTSKIGARSNGVMVLSHLPDSKKELYRDLMETFVNKIKDSTTFRPYLLEGLSHIIRQANPIHREPDDLVGILKVLNKKFDPHVQNKNKLIEMTRTLGQLFDAMADCKVQDLEYEELYKPLYNNLKSLNSDSNQELSYHAKYACQALICIPNNKSPWKEFLQAVQGIIKFAGAVKNIDPGKLPDAFKDLSEGLESIINITVDLIKEIKSVKEGVDNIKQDFSLEIHRKWYWALRFTDFFIQSHKFANSELDTDIRKGAIDFLNNICQNKDQWGSHPKLNEWILEHLKLPKCIQASDSSIPTTLLKDILSKQALNKSVRPTQQSDLKKVRGDMSELNGLKDKFFSDMSEFEEDFKLYVKLQGAWEVSIIKLFDTKREMTSECKEGYVEDVVNRFLNSKEELTSNDKKVLEVAVNLSNSMYITSIIKAVNSFFAPENKLTLEDESELKKVANQILDLKVNKALELQEIIISKFLHSSINKELLMEAINNVLKKNSIIIDDEDVKFLEIKANTYSNLNDKKCMANEFLAFKAKKKLEIAVNKIVFSKCKKVLLILGMGGTGKSTFCRHLARHLWRKYDKSNKLQSPIPLYIPLARLKGA